jgi:hypothetical protein
MASIITRRPHSNTQSTPYGSETDKPSFTIVAAQVFNGVVEIGSIKQF